MPTQNNSTAVAQVEKEEQEEEVEGSKTGKNRGFASLTEEEGFKPRHIRYILRPCLFCVSFYVRISVCVLMHQD